MPIAGLAVFAAAVVMSTLVCLTLLWLKEVVSADKGSKDASLAEADILFSGQALLHATFRGQAILADIMGTSRDPLTWSALQSKLMSRYPGLPTAPEGLTEGFTRLNAIQPNDATFLKLIRNGSQTSVVFGEIEPPKRHEPGGQECYTQRSAELAPVPSWITDSAGAVVWHNAAYADLLDQVPANAHLGHKQVFPNAAPNAEKPHDKREGIKLPNEDESLWFHVTARASESDTVYHATDIAPVVRAEAAQRNFVQTLAMTFAHLPIGLAIFDRNGKLALFNPALVDLSYLQAEFLSRQPDMLSFFDGLRENRRMPEPKDYRTWRQTLAKVISAAESGTYQEHWSLDNGQTLRITGRPHPDAAIAFLIEDISSEISLTRQFRAELEQGQSILDAIGDGIVVYSATGVLTNCNAAFRKMWRMDPGGSFADVNIHDTLRIWETQVDHNKSWTDLRTHLLSPIPRDTFHGTITHKHSGPLGVCSKSIGNGVHMIRFKVPAATSVGNNADQEHSAV